MSKRKISVDYCFSVPLENDILDNIVAMARQSVRSVISSVQRVAIAISPSGLSPSVGPKLSAGSPEALTLAHWICQSYRQVVCLFLLIHVQYGTDHCDCFYQIGLQIVLPFN